MSARSMVVAVMAVAGIAAAAWQLSQRVQSERPGNVAIVLDWDEILRLAAASGTSTQELLQRLRGAASHVALVEDNLPGLRDRGIVQVLSGPLVPQTFVPAGYLVINVATWTHADQIQQALRAKGIMFEPTIQAGGTLAPIIPVGRSFLVPQAICRATELGLGYDAQAAALIRQAGLELVARPRSALVGSEESVKGCLGLARAVGARIVIFVGAEVVGNPLCLAATKEGLDANQLKFGWLELSPQLGADRLARILEGRVVRTHSISEDEMHVLTAEQAADRYVRAVRERGIKALYVRFLPTAPSGHDLLSANLAYLENIAARLRSHGYAIGEPDVPPPLETHPGLRAGVGLGLAAVAVAAAGALGWGWVLSPLGMLAAAAIATALGAAGGLWNDLLALGGVVLAASAGLLSIRPPEDTCRQPLWSALLSLMVVTAVSAGGATLAAALLSDRLHLSGAALFRGVKLSLLLPPLAVLLVQAARSTRTYQEWRLEGGEAGEWPALVAGLKEAAQAGIRYWHAAVAVVAIAAAGLMLLRSGNEPRAGRAEAEVAARTVLEQTFGVRPRTKEFAIGHPALLLGLWLLYRGRKRGAWLALTAGAIGQASVANSFCHLHSPYLLTVQRMGLGLGLGAAVGLVLIAVWSLAEVLNSRPCT
ncbi:MAG: DUF5693 family protein [Armatimonadetes bacterium]|nr:DUF5693 family protein [Armatimonadota bacterium]